MLSSAVAINPEAASPSSCPPAPSAAAHKPRSGRFTRGIFIMPPERASMFNGAGPGLPCVSLPHRRSSRPDSVRDETCRPIPRRS
jgi:hypothetical protein